MNFDLNSILLLTTPSVGEKIVPAVSLLGDDVSAPSEVDNVTADQVQTGEHFSDVAVGEHFFIFSPHAGKSYKNIPKPVVSPQLFPPSPQKSL